MVTSLKLLLFLLLEKKKSLSFPLLTWLHQLLIIELIINIIYNFLNFTFKCQQHIFYFVAVINVFYVYLCCQVQLYEFEFKRQGDKEWLQGIEKIPAKLRALCEINKLLAHQPWLLSPSHMEVLFIILHKKVACLRTSWSFHYK